MDIDLSTYLDLHEAAARLAVSHRTIQRYVAAGQLASVKIGNKHRIDPDELVRFVEAASTTSSDADEQ